MKQAKGIREHIADDEYVTRYPEGSRFRLRIDSADPQPNWVARQEATHTSPMHAGTPVLFEDSLWEVRLAGPTERPPLRHIYYLNPWDDSVPVRPPIEYSAETVTELARQRRLASQREQRSASVRLLTPLMGMLPAEDQERLALAYDLRPRFATGLSAVLLLVLSIGTGLWFFWATASPEGPAWAKDWALQARLAASYFALESLVRIWASFEAQLPLGSLPVAGPITVARTLRRELDPTLRRSARRDHEIATQTASSMLAERDEITFFDGDPQRIEVRSMLDKAHWTLNRTGIGFENGWWLPRERHPPDRSCDRWRFVLEQIEEDAGLPTYLEYVPTEVRRLWAAQQRDRRQTWVDTFAPVLGLLAPEEQERLRWIYGFDPLRYTRSSLILTFLLGAPLTAIALGHLASGDATKVDGVALLVGILLCFDGFRRWQSPEPRLGSLVAPLLRPFTRPLLDTPHPDEIPLDDREHPRGAGS